MKSANYSVDLKLKDLLNNASKDFAWEVLQLQISMECNQKPLLEGLMRLIQLYMLGVEVLQNKDDERYNYFNNKIHTIMMRKSVVEQLHRIATGSAPDPDTMERVQKMEMENRKSQYQLQISLQKDQYTINSIKQILKKVEHQDLRQNQHIKDNLQGQNQVLQQRIKNRKLRSISRGKPNEVELSPKVYSKKSYGVMSISEKELHQQRFERIDKNKQKQFKNSKD